IRDRLDGDAGGGGRLHRVLGASVDELGAQLDGQRPGRLPQGQHPSAPAGPGIEKGDGAARLREVVRGGEAGGAGADHQDVHGPFGRTEIGAIVIAADPAASKLLVETYDGDLWIYDVDAGVRRRLSTLRVGDEVILAFDDRVAGERVLAVNLLPPGTRPVPPG